MRLRCRKHRNLTEQLQTATLNWVKASSWFGDFLKDGAGGQNRTGYARLFRAALYH
jgi:hypothetical protein